MLNVKTTDAHRRAFASHITGDAVPPLFAFSFAAAAIRADSARIVSSAIAAHAPASLPPALACAVSTCALTTTTRSSYPNRSIASRFIAFVVVAVTFAYVVSYASLVHVDVARVSAVVQDATP